MTEPKPVYENSNVQGSAGMFDLPEEETAVSPGVSYANVPMNKAGQVQLGTLFAFAIATEGAENALEAYMKLKAMGAVVNAAISALVDHAIDEADLYTVADDKVLRGVKFNVSSGAAKYTYDGDAEWANIKGTEKELAAKRKKREQFLRALETAVVDPDTGEMSTPAVQTSMGNRQLRVTFPKE